MVYRRNFDVMSDALDATNFSANLTESTLQKSVGKRPVVLNPRSLTVRGSSDHSRTYDRARLEFWREKGSWPNGLVEEGYVHLAVYLKNTGRNIVVISCNGERIKRRKGVEGEKKCIAGESASDAGLTAEEEMERVWKRIVCEMSERFTRLHETDARFGFLLDIKTLCYGTDDCDDLKKKCKEFGDFYGCDVNGKQLYEEILDVRMLISTRKNVNIKKSEELLEFIVQYGDESVFPNLRISIQILLTIAVSIANCERSFSKLKLILSYLRATMGQERLCDLALLSIEREETEKTDFENIIDMSQKAGKLQL
ncbi:uncharacterized protein [Centruroides vittatus]|uniref:uncharacterized protein n=1 Tax=Centruroides vittatus TaxID=120091 RepID=UPI00350FEE38